MTFFSHGRNQGGLLGKIVGKWTCYVLFIVLFSF